MANNTPRSKQDKAAKKSALRIVAERKVNGADYGVSGRWATVTVLAASNRGRNARGSTGAKRGWGSGNAKHAKRAHRQGADRMGNCPRIARTNPFPV